MVAALALAPSASAWTTFASGVQNAVVPSAIVTLAGTELVSWETPIVGTISVSRANGPAKTVVTGDPIPGRTQLIQQPNGAIQLYFPNAKRGRADDLDRRRPDLDRPDPDAVAHDRPR